MGSPAEMRGILAVAVLICGMLCSSVTGFVMQESMWCTFSDNKEGNITFNYAYVFNRQPALIYSKRYAKFLQYPYSIGEMRAVVGQFATQLNTDPEMPNRVQKEEERCKQNVKTFWDKTVKRRAKPSVEVFFPVQVRPESLPVLVCHVSGFYPSDIGVAWFKNDILVKNFTAAVRAGDWTYQVVATLDMRNSQTSDNYTCLVTHETLDGAIVKIWKHGLTEIQIIKISVAVVVFAVGLVVFIVGLVLWWNVRRAGYTPIPGYNDVQ